MQRRLLIRLGAVCLVSAGFVLAACSEAGQAPLQPEEIPTADLQVSNTPSAPALLVSGLEGASGSTVGPGGALFVTEGAAGRISRVDPETGAVTTFASGLPPQVIPLGGAIDVAFIGGTAYVLVTVVDDPLFPTGQINGIYRVDGPNSFTVIADLGAFNVANPPSGSFGVDLVTGVLYALDVFRGGFLVTDGHLNRVLYVTRDGEISVFRAFGNIVPTGLEVHGNTIYMGEAGPVPHLPETGKVVALQPGSPGAAEVASGARLIVDVERGRGRTLFALSQGDFPVPPPPAGAPALPNTGALVKVESNGTFSTVVDELNLPTSVELIGNTAYVVSLAGEIWRIDNVSGPPFGRAD